MTLSKLFAALSVLVLPLEVLASDIAVLDPGKAPEQAVVMFQAAKEGVAVGIVRATDVDQVANVTVIEKLYEEICTAPCSFALDAGWHELHFEYQKQEWTKKVHIEAGVQELYVRPMTPVGIVGAYSSLGTGFLLFPITVPMWVAGAQKVKVRETDAVAVVPAGPEA
jgi:hypothetical protein